MSDPQQYRRIKAIISQGAVDSAAQAQDQINAEDRRLDDLANRAIDALNKTFNLRPTLKDLRKKVFDKPYNAEHPRRSQRQPTRLEIQELTHAFLALTSLDPKQAQIIQEIEAMAADFVKANNT